MDTANALATSLENAEDTLTLVDIAKVKDQGSNLKINKIGARKSPGHQ